MADEASTAAPASSDTGAVLARAAALVGRAHNTPHGRPAAPTTPPAAVAAACAAALALQERAARVPPGPERARLLEAACAQYAEAEAAAGGSEGGAGLAGGSSGAATTTTPPQSTRPPPGALYNAAVAQSEVARAAPPGPARAARLATAARAYAAAVAADPTPQALNNFGLVCHELATTAGASAAGDNKGGGGAAAPPLAAAAAASRPALAAGAVARFRAALRSHPTFERAVYNLGTVLYAYGSSASREGGPVGASAAASLATAAQCVALAASLAPGADVYRRSLAAVRHLLPLPFLRAGWLLVADGGGVASAAGMGGLPPAAERWRARWCALDWEGLHVGGGGRGTTPPPPPPALVAAAGEGEAGGAGGAAGSHPPPPAALPLASLAGAVRVADLALPEGAAFWVPPPSSSPSPCCCLGTFFVAVDEADADGWVDACVVGGRVEGGALGAVLK